MMTASSSIITFRDIQESDFLEIKELHRECFPVQYEDSFFLNACKRLGVRNTPLISVIAVECESSKVIGCILAQFNKVGKIEDKNLFADSYEPAREVLYILTLGLTQEYRRSGLGTRLLQFALDTACNNAGCGAIYLHVIHYNEAAIRFYERNDFIFFRSLDEFYFIGESYFMAYLYILYVNGHRAPLLHRVYLNARATAKQSLNYLFSWVTSFVGGGLPSSANADSNNSADGLHIVKHTPATKKTDRNNHEGHRATSSHSKGSSSSSSSNGRGSGSSSRGRSSRNGGNGSHHRVQQDISSFHGHAHGSNHNDHKNDDNNNNNNNNNSNSTTHHNRDLLLRLRPETIATAVNDGHSHNEHSILC